MKSPSTVTPRRRFLRTAAQAAAATAAAPHLLLTACASGETPLPEPTPVVPVEPLPEDPPAGARFLFQGDSITEAGRGYNQDTWITKYVFGQGYVYGIASRLLADFPHSDLTIFNRGVAGDAIWNLRDRWQRDTLDLHPDVLTVLIGANHTIIEPAANIPAFEAMYAELLAYSRAANPRLTLVLCCPFVLPVGGYLANWELYGTDIALRSEVVHRLAAQFDAVVVDYPALFDDVTRTTPPAYWAADGIHPTPAGHELMAREWLRQAAPLLPYLQRYLPRA